MKPILMQYLYKIKCGIRETYRHIGTNHNTSNSIVFNEDL